MSAVNIAENAQQCNTTKPKATGDFIEKQPLLFMSGIGAALGSAKLLMREVRKISSPLRSIKLFNVKRLIPRYMRSNFVKYPAMMMIFLITAQRLRLMLNH